MNIWDKVKAIALGKESDYVPVVLEVYGTVLKRFHNVKEYEYYQNVKLQLEAKVAFQKRFPTVLNLGNGTYPEYGEGLTIPTAFGAKLRFFEDSPPYTENYPIRDPEDVDRIVDSGIPDVKAGVASEILKRLEYFYEWFPKDIREEYGYVDGVICPGVCVEGAALAMGYDKFIIWMRKYPDVLHKWLKIATDWQLKYCEAIEEIVGKCKVLWLPDHLPHMLRKEQFREFVLPYLNKIFGRYKNAFRIWHNEGYVGYMLDEVDKIDAEVWHLGPKENIAICKEKTHFCIWGNIKPIDLANMSPDQVKQKCEEIISIVKPGRFWLSTGGGVSVGTPFKNIDMMVKVAEKYSKK
ncbi:MAG: uroporphyrinogen decarboxylase family protein [Candidatus Methanomethylicaceae archaeon]